MDVNNDFQKPVSKQAEIDNANKAVIELRTLGYTNCVCLRCGSKLVINDVVSAYQVKCERENRVILTVRGL